MYDNVCIEEIKADAAFLPSKDHADEVKIILYADVLIAVDKAFHITSGVRSNMKSAVTKIALRISAAGLQGPVKIPALQTEFERLTPAILNFKTDASLAALKSNLRAALRLAGIDVMPGRHVTPLTPAWAELIDGFQGNRIFIKLSRFAHVASQQGWEPEEVCTGHLDRFRAILDQTNLGSKAAKVVRGTITAWSYGREHVAGWPAMDLGCPPAETRFYTLRWADFPESFRQDVETYLDRKNQSFLGQLQEFASSDVAKFLTEPMAKKRAHGMLREKTKISYRGAFLRAASILVRTGQPASDVTGIVSLVGVEEILKILTFLSDRTKREEGGHLGSMALVLFIAARDHVKVSKNQESVLRAVWEKVRGPVGKMSKRSFDRLLQFDDEAAKNKMSALPHILATAARCHGKMDAISIKLFRTALFIAIGLDTGNRAGNIINLKLDLHVSLRPKGKRWMAEVANPGSEVKNHDELFSTVKSGTAALIREWIDVYRPVILKEAEIDSPYLFPNKNGGHLAGTLATQSMKDLAAYHAGLDMTPHAMRPFVGKVVLDKFPDAYPDVQKLLGHRRLETTISYYAPIRAMMVKRRSQELLLRCEEAYHVTL